ncbi:MAG TPA: VOC family protein [Candidatus Micrarchaeaceae archaeon]|nr:VOC family protein [Candidatus Micrarchaeaceae archaeon]
MKVLGINWLGVKTPTFATSRDFFTEVIGLQVTYQAAEFAVMELPDGDKLEIFGPQGPDSETQSRQGSIVAGFWVDDIGSAVAELVNQGVELIGGIEGKAGRHQWQRFRAPDGNEFELCSDPQRRFPG